MSRRHATVICQPDMRSPTAAEAATGSFFFTASSSDGGNRLKSGSLGIFDYSDVGQVAIAFREIQSVSHHELVRNFETKVIDRHFFFATLVLIEQCRQLHAGRAARLQI